MIRSLVCASALVLMSGTALLDDGIGIDPNGGKPKPAAVADGVGIDPHGPPAASLDHRCTIDPNGCPTPKLARGAGLDPDGQPIPV